MQVFGARGSGTNWFEALMQINYRGVKIMRTHSDGGSDNYGWKHGDLGTEKRIYVDGSYLHSDGYGFYVFEAKGIKVAENDQRYSGVDEDGDHYIINNALPLEKDNSEKTLLVVIYRNPLTWLRSIHKKPHHTLELVDMDFSQFIRHRWRTYAGSPNSEHAATEERQKWINKGVILEDELSVFAHRAKSIEITESFKNRVQNVVYVPYESASKNPKDVLAGIAELYDIAMNSEFVYDQSYKGRGKYEFTGTRYEDLKENDLHYILNYLRWDEEAGIGYYLLYHPETFTPTQIADPAELLNIKPDVRYYQESVLVYQANK